MKKLLPILLFIGLFSFASKAQDPRVPGETAKIAKLYPNPATSYITFDLQKNNRPGLTISVYNFLGKKMYENQKVGEKTTVTLNDFARGVYIYHITDQTGKILDTGKFQVAR